MNSDPGEGELRFVLDRGVLLELQTLPIFKGTDHDFSGQENPFIIFRSKEIYIYFKTNNKLPLNLLK